ncbi:unnamed protein product [Diatraea saccharalis]|uniref:Uncharacterized protein n=1 Tax=Diatraea saccharalis TaxID=40085 RepID=A0A9N9R6R6_9NEOP|nr:unnamed protein product [Diatraea saccharalis]
MSFVQMTSNAAAMSPGSSLLYLHNEAYLFHKSVWSGWIDGYLGKENCYTDSDVSNKSREDLIMYIDHFMQECYLHPYQVTLLAQILSPAAVERMCRQIFSVKSLRTEFVEAFYTVFIPNYIKRFYSWSIIDLLKRANVAYPGPFKKLVQNLMQNTEVHEDILKDYVINISAKDKNNVMTSVAGLRLTAHQFMRQLKTINILFKGSDKSTVICEFVVEHLQEYSCFCYKNKDFGRLLLTYLQNFSCYPIDHETVRKMIDGHCTEFKSPCQTIFWDIYHELQRLQYQLMGGPRFYVDRPEKEVSTFNL